MKKTRINSDDIINELKGKSPYFTEPNGTSNARTNERTPERTETQNSEDPIISSYNNPIMEPKTKRYSFEIYESQEKEIVEIQNRFFKKSGKRLSASKIIRTALTEYLQKLNEALKE